ncbi:MAG: hypothetical protein FJ276_15960 [Planctomycetes bacterium]|nr:hypothetical protein [Planctomycetota bacterium]
MMCSRRLPSNGYRRDNWGGDERSRWPPWSRRLPWWSCSSATSAGTLAPTPAAPARSRGQTRTRDQRAGCRIPRQPNDAHRWPLPPKRTTRRRRIPVIRQRTRRTRPAIPHRTIHRTASHSTASHSTASHSTASHSTAKQPGKRLPGP